MKTNEGRVYFALDGDDFDPDEVTKLLGIEPTSIRRKGSRIPGKVPVDNSWELCTEQVVGEYIDVYEMSAEIVSQLIPLQDLIIEAIEKFNLSPRLQVVLWFSANSEQSTPAIGFEKEIVAFLGRVGVLVDIDTYTH
ncbi:DUF4279 domain-containing protein [Teredinibacter turnerae]|uniref:DUF4279 domain-containing protein n=1 Tax=Teredinibacter turnerae TaxID=2426 RepID=UPI00035EC2E9|nr:DUF4279 domain-containing protein [Teredinibacter turnerae]